MNDCINSVIEDCIVAIMCPRGEFYPDKNYGSKIKFAGSAIDEDRLLCYARQALNDMDGVYVKSVCKTDGTAQFILSVNNEERQVTVEL